MWLWLLPKLLSAGAWLKQAGRYLVAHPMTAVALAAAIWGWMGWHESAKHKRQAEHCAAAQKTAKAAAAKADADSKAIAETSDANHQDHLAAASVVTSDYIRTHRVRAAASTASGASNGAAVPVDTAAVPFVVTISEPDVNSCAADFAYASDAHDWALSLIDKGLGRPAD